MLTVALTLTDVEIALAALAAAVPVMAMVAAAAAAAVVVKRLLKRVVVVGDLAVLDNKTEEGRKAGM